MSLRIVPDQPEAPLTFDEANAEFKARWRAARKAYADLLSQSGSLAHPLYIQGDVGRHQILRAQHAAEQIAKHAAELLNEIEAVRDLWDRAAEGSL